MERHDYVRHTIDCLEEAETALQLALRRGLIDPDEQRELARHLRDLSRIVDRTETPH